MESTLSLKGCLVTLKTPDCFVRGRVVDFRIADDPLQDLVDNETLENVWLEDVEELEEKAADVVDESVEDLLREGIAVPGLQQFHAAEILEFRCLDAGFFRREKGVDDLFRRTVG